MNVSYRQPEEEGIVRTELAPPPVYSLPLMKDNVKTTGIVWIKKGTIGKLISPRCYSVQKAWIGNLGD
jgi:hypothetical protein